jgi:hypothetical protein
MSVSQRDTAAHVSLFYNHAVKQWLLSAVAAINSHVRRELHTAVYIQAASYSCTVSSDIHDRFSDKIVSSAIILIVKRTCISALVSTGISVCILSSSALSFLMSIGFLLPC